MKKISITKEYNLLEREDVEKAVSEMAGHPVKLEDMDVRIGDCLPLDSGIPDGLYIEIGVDGEDVFDNDFNGPLDELCDDLEFMTDESLIFDFNVSLFKSFGRFIDTSD